MAGPFQSRHEQALLAHSHEGRTKVISPTSTDAELVSAVARHQDHTAFTLLFDRHAQSAFALAMHLTGNRACAEEALQETMMKVWQNARKYREDGEVRSWIMCMLTSISLKKRKRQKREQEIEPRTPTSASTKNSEALAENEELHKALKTKVKALPEHARQILALYFLGGLTQDEIGQQLSMPQRTVSKRITETLRLLKNDLAGAGFSGSTASVFFKDFFGEGMHLRPEWAQQVRATITDTSPDLPLPEGTSVASAFPWLAALTFCAAASAGLYHYSKSTPGNQTAPPPTLAAKKTPPTASTSPLPRVGFPLPAQWDFTEGPSADLKIVEGTWHWWKSFATRTPSMVFHADANTPSTGIIQLKETAPHQPLLITVKSGSHTHGPGAGQILIAWGTQDALLPMKSWAFSRLLDYRSKATFKIYVYDQWVVAYVNGALKGISKYAKPYPGERLYLIGNNQIVESLRVEGLAEAALPELVRDQNQLQQKAETSTEPIFMRSGSFRFSQSPQTQTKSDHWDLSAGIPSDWTRIKGQWKYDSREKGLQVAPQSRSSLIVGLPPRYFVQPFMIEVKTRIIAPKKPVSLVAFWTGKTGLPSFENKMLQIRFNKFTRSRVEVIKIYFIDRFVIHCLQDKPITLMAYDHFYPTGGTCFQFQNWSILSLTQRLLTPEEIPISLRDPASFYDSQTGVEAKRSGL